MNRRCGFSLIELLVVIAVISILAGITFPVYARVKDDSYRNSDLSNLRQLGTALNLYKADQEAFPPAILGYATGYSNFTPSDADIVPARELAGGLYPRRVPNLETLRPAYNRLQGDTERLFTTAVWPEQPVEGNADPLARQRFGPNDGPVSRCVGAALQPNYYYRVSGFDVANVQSPSGARTELRYTLFWSGYSVPSTCNPVDASGSAADDPRQLGYSDPPGNTVVTWNSYFREYDNGVPTFGGRREQVLFLDGSAKAYESREVAKANWQFRP
jgi:prepilin-type N-terminal cleavage/methylation domain-containing protein